jgi:hypothetical protein
MDYERNARVRDARLMTGITLLGGRNASATEVDRALGVAAPPVQAGHLRGRLRRLVARLQGSGILASAPAKRLSTSE